MDSGFISLEAAGEGLLALALVGLAALLLSLYWRSEDRACLTSLLVLFIGITLGLAGLSHFVSLFASPSQAQSSIALVDLAAGLIGVAAVVCLWRALPLLHGWLDRNFAAETAANASTRSALDDAERKLQDCMDAHEAQLASIGQRFDMALRNSPIGVFTQDPDLRFTWVHNPPEGLSENELLGKRDDEVLPPAIAGPIVKAKQAAMDTRKPQELETSYEISGRRRSLHISIEPMLGQDGEVAGTVSVVVDVTQREAKELQVHLLLRELTHRSKNLLAVINAIARQTGSRTGSLEEFLENFNARLVSIGSAHDLLVADDWRGASLRNLVKSQLHAHLKPCDDQIEVEGEDIMLKPDAVQNVGLALHELFVNAQRYGALSTGEGQVNVHWGKFDGEGVKLVWEESGGPQVPEPNFSGFGRVMIENVVEKALNGVVDLSFEPKGVRCEIVIPRKQITAD